MRTWFRMTFLLLAGVLAGCGFHLRGQVGMNFSTLYLSAAPSPFVSVLRETLESNGIKLVTKSTEADVVLEIVSEAPDKQILSLSGAGAVSEYQLRYLVSLRAYDKQQRDWIPAMEMEQQRILQYSDTAVLAKEAEEALLWQNMRTDMVQQILRRLSRAKPQPVR